MGKSVDYKPEHWSNAFAIQDYQNHSPIVVTVNNRAATRAAIIQQVRQKKMEFIERSSWHAHKNRAEEMKDDWDYTMIAIHHAGRSSVCGPGAFQLLDIQNSQMANKVEPKDDISYHYAIDCNGGVYEARDIRFKGEHLHQYNTGAIGIVLLENLTDPGEGDDTVSYFTKLFFSKPTVPSAQENSVKELILTLKDFFPIKSLGGHREFPKQQKSDKVCPGNVGIALVKRLRAETGIVSP